MEKYRCRILVAFPSHLKKITFYTEMLTRKVELWIFSLISLVKKTPQNNFSCQNFSVIVELTRILSALFNNFLSIFFRFCFSSVGNCISGLIICVILLPFIWSIIYILMKHLQKICGYDYTIHMGGRKICFSLMMALILSVVISCMVVQRRASIRDGNPMADWTPFAFGWKASDIRIIRFG